MKTCLAQIRRMLCPLLFGGIVWLLFHCVFYIGFVPAQSTSMEPTIPAGRLIIGLRIFDEPERGDIIVFEKDAAILVKRVFAVEGDTVYISPTMDISLEPSFTPDRVLKVPPHSLFVVGDNAEVSLDSRKWAQPFVPRGAVLAQVWCVL